MKCKLLFMLILLASIVHAQSDGAALLFQHVKTSLTDAEKNNIYKQTGFLLSKDKKQFIQDAESADYPFDAMVYVTDLNKDKQEEVFIVFGNTYTSGNAGSNVVMFIKNTSGTYKSNLGFPGTAPDILPTKNLSYPDLLIGGPGFEFPVWRWNGKEYAFHRTMKEQEMQKIKTINIEEASKNYAATLKQ